MNDQHPTDRTDDADARGEHDYGTRRPKDVDQPVSSPVHRRPNTYVAGEHGTQQVTAPPSTSSAEEHDKDDSKSGPS